MVAYQGVYDIEDSISGGNDEIVLKVKPQAEALGITLSDLATRVRYGFYCAEVPFSQVAECKTRPGYSAINISASVDKALAEPMKISRELQDKVLPKLAEKYGIETALEGTSLEEADAITDLALGFLQALFGLIALAGVVVNDSLVMVDFVNESRRNGAPLKEAVVGAGTRRYNLYSG